MYHHAGLVLGVDTATLPAAWERTTPGLIPVGDPFSRRRVTVVVGDTPDDFALAVIYQRLYGNALWIHSAWSPADTQAGKTGSRARLALRVLGYRVRQLGHAVVTSTSADLEVLEDIRARIAGTDETDNAISDELEPVIEALDDAPDEARQPQTGEPPAAEHDTEDATDEQPGPEQDQEPQASALEPDAEASTDPDTGPDIGPDTEVDTAAEGSSEEGPASAAALAVDAAARHAERMAKVLKVEPRPDFPDRGMLNLAVTEEYSTRMTLPVLRDEQAVVLSTTPPPLRPTDKALAGRDIAWHVDLRIAESTMPLGRGLNGEQLAATPDATYETWIRSGNRGVSYDSRNEGWVSSGANAEQRLARPRLRMLSLQEWCRVMAAQVGYDVGWSDAGRRARLLESMWGSRAAMTADVAGNFTNLARVFTRTGSSTKTAYPEGGGTLITGGGFLSFTAIRDALQPATPTCTDTGTETDTGTGTGDEATPRQETERDLQARTQLDTYLTRGIIRRGLILRCHTCEALTFVPVDDLGQRNRCPRCGSDTDLTLDAWRKPTTEPTWFYDLHQVARDFLRDNGHAPAWLAHHLAKKARDYADCAEMNLYRKGTRTSIAEADLIALVDGTLLAAEVKTCDYLGNSVAERAAASNKRIRWAAVLQADEIVLASTELSWQQTSIDAMRTKLAAAIADNVFAPDRTPRLRLINGLGTSATTEAYVDVAP